MTKFGPCIHPCSKFHIGWGGAVKVRPECDEKEISPANKVIHKRLQLPTLT